MSIRSLAFSSTTRLCTQRMGSRPVATQITGLVSTMSKRHQSNNAKEAGEEAAAVDAKPPKMVTFEIYRWPGEGEPYVELFEIDQNDCGPMVLDALIKIKNEIDPSLTFRRSCREGICGSCAMNISGTNSLACLRGIEESIEHGDRVRINPLPHMSVVKDLVPDLSIFYEQHKSIEPWLQPSEEDANREHEILQSPEDRKRLDGLYECILCACCQTSCPSYWWHGEHGYMGPAVLLQAFRWVADSRDAKTEERIERINSSHVNLFECKKIFNCATVCPKNLNPGVAVQHLQNITHYYETKDTANPRKFRYHPKEHYWAQLNIKQ